MATAFIAERGAADFPLRRPYDAGASFKMWGTFEFEDPIEAGDTVLICWIPANTYVIGGHLRAEAIDTGTPTLELDVGFDDNDVDSADPDAFLDSGVLDGDIYAPFTGILQAGGPKLFTVATAVLVTAVAAADAGGTGRITVDLDCCNPQPGELL